MTLVLFYEKPGCTTNARQKKSLNAVGCTLIVQNLLELNMADDELRTYLEPLPVAQWFNPNAPAIKSGEINPDTYDEQTALQTLLDDPILIRRPLISINGQRMCGFDQQRIESLIGHSLDATVNNGCASADEVCRES